MPCAPGFQPDAGKKGIWRLNHANMPKDLRRQQAERLSTQSRSRWEVGAHDPSASTSRQAAGKQRRDSPRFTSLYVDKDAHNDRDKDVTGVVCYISPGSRALRRKEPCIFPSTITRPCFLTPIPRHSNNYPPSSKYSSQRTILLSIAYYELSDYTAAYRAALVLHPLYRMRRFADPVLRLLAFDTLAAPASSSGDENAFGMPGLMLDGRRCTTRTPSTLPS